MKKILFVIIAIVFLAAGGAVFAQENAYYFLDGFSLNLPPSYSIYPTNYDDSGREDVIELVNPWGDSVYGILYYDEDKWMDDQSYIINLIYEEGAVLYADEYNDGEVTDIEYDMLFDGTDCYWVTVVNEESSYAILAVDLFFSPGHAVGVFFCFPPFLYLEYENQVEILNEMKADLFVEFFDAAG